MKIILNPYFISSRCRKAEGFYSALVSPRGHEIIARNIIPDSAIVVLAKGTTDVPCVFIHFSHFFVGVCI